MNEKINRAIKDRQIAKLKIKLELAAFGFLCAAMVISISCMIQ